MSVYNEKNNPPLWFLIIGIIIVSIIAVLVMLAPTKKYTQANQYYLKDAQSRLINNAGIIDPDKYIYSNANNPG